MSYQSGGLHGELSQVTSNAKPAATLLCLYSTAPAPTGHPKKMRKNLIEIYFRLMYNTHHRLSVIFFLGIGRY